MVKKIIVLVFIITSSFLIAQEDSDVLYKKAKEALKSNNFRKAANLSLKGLKMSPNNLDIKEVLGKSYLEMGKLDSARYLLKKVVDGKRENATSLQYLINTEFISKRYSSAVCYVNELLQKKPYDKGLWIKKISIYDKMGNQEEAIRSVKRLKSIFPKDEKVSNIYNYLMLEKGKKNLKSQNLEEAKNIYNKVLLKEPNNKSALLSLIKSELLSGDKEAALIIIERALIVFPSDNDFIKKKIGVLSELGRYDEAIVFAKKKNKQKQYSGTLRYLMQEATTFYKNQNPYELRKKEYDLTGSKKLATKIIATAIAKGQNDDAKYYIDKELKKNSDDKEIFLLKLQYFSRNNNQLEYNRLLSKLHKKFPEDYEIREKYNFYVYNKAKKSVLQEDYVVATNDFLYLATHPEYETLALENLFSIYQIKGNYNDASTIIDKLMSIHKNDNAKYLAKKSALYEKMGNYEEALKISKKLIKDYPTNKSYKDLYKSESETYVSFLMKDEQYKKALDFITVSTLVIPNENLNSYAINASVAIGDLERAKSFGKISSELQPENKELSLKMADVYLNAKNYDTSIKILENLRKKYLYSKKINRAYAEVLYRKGKESENRKEFEPAINYYKRSVGANPSKENASANSLVNLYLKTKESEEALKFINKQLKVSPSNNLYYKKGVAFEQMKKLDSAYHYQKMYNPTIKEYENWSNHINYLKFKKLKNEFEFIYQSYDSDSLSYKFATASLKYTRFTQKNNYSAGVSYFAKRNGIGLQLNLLWNHIFSKTIYADFRYDIANRFFPKHRISTSVFKTFKRDYELELGARFAVLNSNKNIITGIVGGSKIIDVFWLNAKVFVISDNNNIYNNIVGQAKYFLNDTDNISFIVSAGTAPYDEQLGFQTSTFLSYVNSMVGLGFNKQIKDKINVTLNGYWHNYEEQRDVMVSQLGILLSVRTRF